jgi:hypothetical protein
MSTYIGPARYTYYGKTIHLYLSAQKDLHQVLKLGEVFWLATTAPISEFLLPSAFLEKVDSDGDGRIRVQEVKAAIKWLTAHSQLESPTDVLKREHLKSERLQAVWDKIVKALDLPPGDPWTFEDLEGFHARYISDPTDEDLESQDFLDLERLLLYQAHLLKFCQNFVAFPDLYHPKRRALFERGTLVMDGREFRLALPVSDVAEHKAVAARSNLFILYIEIDDETLAIPVTSGSKGNLDKNKRGVFLHVDGTEREAVVVDLVSNPISLFEVLAAPVEKVCRAFQRQIEAMSGEEQTAKAENPGPPGSWLAGAGIAVAAMGASLAFVIKTLTSLSIPSILFGLIAVLLISLTPAVVAAYSKLRSRDLGPVLEGNAWGINARMPLTAIQAHQFTQSPRHPGYVGSSMGMILVIGGIALAGCLAYFFRDNILQILSGG